jgi:two-component system chemotaxis response regulator CheY
MGQEAMVIEAIQSGAKDFIVKPFKPDRILKTVTSIVGNP